MPTKIVLRETEAPSKISPIRKQASRDDEESQIRRAAAAMSPSRSPRTSSRRIMSFRSSIIREVSNPSEKEMFQRKGLSRTDIRASPRLVGYLFQLLASTVMLISAIQFYRQQEQTDSFFNLVNSDGDLGDRFFISANGPVYTWKLVGCVACSSFGAAVSFLVMLMHFDTVSCLTEFWSKLFRDGSKHEQRFLIIMIFFWSASLYVCTSSLSVGELQANVFFTTWICFGSSLINYGVWRVSAGRESWAERVTHHHRETTYNWLWLLFTSVVLGGAITDMFFNRDEISLQFEGRDVDLSDRDWYIVLGIIWGVALVCFGATCLNMRPVPTSSRLVAGSQFNLGWRHFEGVVIVILLGFFFWLTFEHTGVDAVINGLNNAYFGVWSCFVNSLFTFSTWLRENKDIKYVRPSGRGSFRRSNAVRTSA